MITINNHLGTITYSKQFFYSLIGGTVTNCFGIVGMNAVDAKQTFIEKVPLKFIKKFADKTILSEKGVTVKYKNDKLKAFGLRSMHLMYLYCLDKESGGMTPVELSKKCSVDKAFISRVTTELRKLGYVEYDNDHEPDNKKDPAKYKKRLLLTDKGKQIMTCINEMVEEAVGKITSDITREQLDTFYFVLSKFDDNLEGLLSAI